MISFPILPSHSAVQSSLYKISPKPLDIDSLSFLVYSLNNNNNIQQRSTTYSSQPITYLYIEFRAQNPTSLSQNPMTTHYDSLQLMTTHSSCVIFLPLHLHDCFSFLFLACFFSFLYLLAFIYFLSLFSLFPCFISLFISKFPLFIFLCITKCTFTAL
jgi:hypothetical protein